jgi:ribosomal protein L37AE/L43A
MFVNFGSGKCPVCGDSAKNVEKKEKDVFHCTKCKISFNDFYIANFEQLKEYENKYWN